MPQFTSRSGLFRYRSGHHPPSLPTIVLWAGVLMLPSLLLLLGTIRVQQLPDGQPHLTMWLGTVFQVVLCYFSIRGLRGWRPPSGANVLILYLTALGWLWLGDPDLTDWYPSLAQSILLVMSLLLFGRQVLADSGALDLRRAYVLAQRLANRKEWPADLGSCRTLPEVKALREAVHLDASPALALLGHPRSQVVIAALSALEFRKSWRLGEPELVLQVASISSEPAVRVAAVSALANIDDRTLVERLTTFLDDPSWEVRRAATESLLWDTERRWLWIRHALRESLSDPAHQSDGPLVHNGQLLTPEAVSDLIAWSTEKGVLGLRAALTLGVHFGRALAEEPDDELVGELRRQLTDPHAPTAVRLELAHLFQETMMLDRPLQEQLLDPGNPAPLRLVAAEALLAEEATHLGAIAALRDVARLPNREIALATAAVVQRRLGVDLGLAMEQPLPPILSRQAAEVTRRVMMWAAQYEQPKPVPLSEPLQPR